MSKLSNLTSCKHIIAGTQIVDTICTESDGGNSAFLLREIAKTNSGSRLIRQFPNDWLNENGALVKKGTIEFQGRYFPLTVKIGSNGEVQPRTLIFQDKTGLQCSMKTVEGQMVLFIGDRLDQGRITSLANQAIGTWIVHGNNWHNRVGQKFHDPWGATKRVMFETFSFEIIDGALQNPRPTLSELIELGCHRSTHVGEWLSRHSTIIPAIVGMPMTIHEFKQESGPDICGFNGLNIGTNPKIWGPYCPWNEEVRHSEGMGMWRDLAMRSASPFSFHVHATRTLFPEIQLDSDYLLQVVGLEKLRGILEVIASNQPGRFYRIIDERGMTFRQSGVSDTELKFGDDICFTRSEVVDNVMETFLELQRVQFDSSYTMPRKKRLVIDSHAYLVIETLARRQKVVHELSGRFMHAYLTDGTDAKMHRVRNEELFLLLRDFFGIKTVRFYIYPPLTWHSGLSSQYDENLRFCKKEDWFSKIIS